ncbi:MAG: DUF1934 domain-containing protein [Clostridia bacterium]|nr:DUF1934 domain-containing protein [Clostridia bacterium]
MKKDGKKTVKRTVRLTVRIYDGEEREPYDPFPEDLDCDDPFASFTYPIEDVEDAVLRLVEEKNGALPDDDSELVTPGVFTSDGDEVNITFGDPFAEDGKEARTVINFRVDDPGTVSVMRSGLAGPTLVLEEGKTHVSAFETPAGAIEARVFARRVVNTVSPVTGKGEMYLDHTVSFAGSVPLRSVMTVRAE